MEKTTISNRSSKLFTLSSIYQANKAFLGKSKNDEVSEEEAELVIRFWETVGSYIPEWDLAKKRQVSQHLWDTNIEATAMYVGHCVHRIGSVS